MALQDQQDRKALKALRVRPEPSVQLVHKATLDQRVRQDHKVLPARSVQQVQRDHKVIRALLDPRVQRDRKGKLDRPERRVKLALRVQLDLKALKAM